MLRVDQCCCCPGLCDGPGHRVRGQPGIDHDGNRPDAKGPEQGCDEGKAIGKDDEHSIPVTHPAANQESGDRRSRSVDLGVGHRPAVEVDRDLIAEPLIEPIAKQEPVDVETLGPLRHATRR